MTAPQPFSFLELTGKQPRKAARSRASDFQRTRKTESGEPGSGSVDFTPLFQEDQATSEAQYQYTADDLVQAVEEARNAAKSETEAALRTAFANDVAERRCAMLASIKEQLDRQNSGFEQELDQLACASQKLAIALAQAVIPKTLERHPLGDVADLIKTALRRLKTEPSIELRMNPDRVEMGETLSDDLATESGFAGEIRVVADPNLGEGDIEIRWHGGVMDRRINRLQAEAFGLVDHLLQEPPQEDSHDLEAEGPAQPMPNRAEEAPIEPSMENPQLSEPDDEQ